MNMHKPEPSPLASHWDLDPEVVFLNHGSFGACPRVVMARQQELRARMEAQPLAFLYRDLEGLLDEARKPLARLIGCDADDLAFVPNATTGVNAVLLLRLKWLGSRGFGNSAWVTTQQRSGSPSAWPSSSPFLWFGNFCSQTMMISEISPAESEPTRLRHHPLLAIQG